MANALFTIPQDIQDRQPGGVRKNFIKFGLSLVWFSHRYFIIFGQLNIIVYPLWNFVKSFLNHKHL